MSPADVSRTLVHLVIAVLTLEVLVLVLLRRAWFLELLPHLAAGLALLLAMRSVATDAAWAAAAWLAVAGLAHGAGVWRLAHRR